MAKPIRKLQPARRQLAAHCRLRGGRNTNAAYNLVRGVVGRTTWYRWQTGRANLGVDTLERICDHLGLAVVIVDKKTGKTAGRRQVLDPDD